MEDVARLVERLEQRRGFITSYGISHFGDTDAVKAASTIRALVERAEKAEREVLTVLTREAKSIERHDARLDEKDAEIERLRGDVTMTAAWERRALDAEAKLREAVEVISGLERQVESLKRGNADLAAANRDRRSKTAHLTHAEQRETNERRRADEAEKKLSQAVAELDAAEAKLREAVEIINNVGPYQDNIPVTLALAIDAFLATMEKPRD